MVDYSSLIEAIRAQADLVEFIGSVVSLKRAGKSLMGLCPFHAEKTPSFHVYPEKQRFHCYGCQKSGDVFNFLQEYHQWTFPQAVEYLAQRYQLQDLLKKKEPISEERKDLESLMRDVTRFFHSQLLMLPKTHPAWNMLSKRKIADRVIAKYQLGWSEGFHSLSQRFQNTRQLVELGLVMEGDRRAPLNRFVDRLIFPIYSHHSEDIIGFGGRIVSDTASNKYPKYINSPETIFFKKSQVLYGLNQALQKKNFKSLLVVEGYFDVLQLANHDLECGVAPMGTAFGEEHLKKLFSTRKEIIFCFDGDRAGQEAAFKACILSLPYYTHKVQISFVTLPAEEDPDSYLLKYGKQSFVNLCQKRVRIGEFLFQKLLELHPVEGVDSIVVFVSEAKKLIRTVEDPDARMALMRVLDHYRPLSRKIVAKPTIQPPTFRSISALEWLAVLYITKPVLWENLKDFEKVSLREKAQTSRFSQLFGLSGDRILNDPEWLNFKKQHASFLNLLPSEGIDHEWNEQLRLLGIRAIKE